MDSSPNKVFWTCVGTAVVAAIAAAVSAPVATFFRAATKSAPWLLELLFARKLHIALALFFGVALVLPFVQPTKVGNPLTIVLAVWRAIRLFFALLALAFYIWLTAVTVMIVHELLARGMTLLPRGLRLYLADTPVVHGPIMLTILAFFFFLPFAIPVLWDVIKMVIWFVQGRLALVWSWRQRKHLGPPYLPKDLGLSADVLLVSDLHATAADALTLEGNLTDSNMRAFVTSAIETRKPRAVIAAGDLTDTGAPEAWRRVRELFAKHPVTLYAAPGNHDANFRDLASTPDRFAGFLGAFDLDTEWRMSGSFDEGTVFREVASLAGSAAKRGTQRKRGRKKKRAAAKGTRDGFPILHEHPDLALSVLVLNSNRRESSSPVTNAIGRVGADQLESAAALIAQRKPDRALVIVLHHHVFPPDLRRGTFIERQKLTFLMCTDAAAVLRFAIDHKADAIVHGHKHMPYVRDFDAEGRKMLLISCGSAMYDAKGPCEDEAGNLPSVMGLALEGSKIAGVTFHAAPASQVAAKQAA